MEDSSGATKMKSLGDKSHAKASEAPFTRTAGATESKHTPTRLAWLQHLSTRGECRWEDMPRNNIGSVTNATWRPMVSAELITARYAQRSFREPTTWLFAITDAGRAALAKARA